HCVSWSLTHHRPHEFMSALNGYEMGTRRRDRMRTGVLDRLNVTRTQIIGYLYSFATEKRAWPPEAKRNNEEEAPRHWWESHRVTPAHDALFHLADLVLSIPTSSSSSSERAKVDMLAYIYINYDLHAKVKPDLARLQTFLEAEEQDNEVRNDQEALIF
ncbi:hypothetical protein JG687_00016638, partial [Phytophthora cactorum]